MKNFLKGGFFVALVLLPLKLFAFEAVIYNENVLSKKVSEELSLIGTELYDKIGIYVFVAAGAKTPLEELLQKQNELPKPNVLLAISQSSHKVDIVGSKEALTFLDKEAVLSPYPSTGTILPILTSHKGQDVFNAAILNGYADIAERLAKSFNVKLEHSIGNANRDTMNLLRILIYGFICFALLYYAQRRMKRRRGV